MLMEDNSMTEKLYYQKPYLKKFSAEVITKKYKNGRCLIELDKTIFYPEGGGQPADKGYLNESKVINVLKKDNKIWHILDDDKIKGGQVVKGKIDWQIRFDHMQQHTGQHVISALLYKCGKIRTIGFHISEDYVSIDIDKKIADRDIYDFEKKANEMIYNNVKIDSFFIKKNDLENYTLRKKPTVEDNIRLVQIANLDITPCGGTHLSNTGELGIIKVINIENYKEGLRIKFVCGKRATRDYHKKNKIIAESREILSTTNNNIINKIKKLKETLDNKDKEINNLKESINSYRYKNLLQNSCNVNNIRIIKKVFCNDSFHNIRMLAKKLISQKDIVVIFGLRHEEKVQIITGRSGNLERLNMNDVIKIPLAIIKGSGGGNALMAQGGSDECEHLEKAISKTYNEIKNLLK